MNTTHVVEEKIYFSTQENVFSVHIDKGYFICGHDLALNKVFCFFSKKEIPSMEIFAQLKAQEFSTETTKIKYVGVKEDRSFILDLFQSKGWREIKYINREELGNELFFYSPTGRLRVEVPQHSLESSAIMNENSIIFNQSETPSAAIGKKIKVLIIDDSVTIHKILKRILKDVNDIEVVGAIQDPQQVERAIKDYQPDVMTVDIHMEGLDGISLLKNILPKYPIPSLLVSSLSLKDGPFVLDGLQAGAVDHIQKPAIDQLDSFASDIIEKIRTASVAKVKVPESYSTVSTLTRSISMDTQGFVAIGASTGGTEALAFILSQLPANIPPIVIVQHIPAQFSGAFAQRLDKICPFNVVEAKSGMAVNENTVYVAPGGLHTKIVRRQNGLAIEVYDGALVNRHKPSVDVLFDSVLREVSPHKAVVVLLTGMGSDGARGLLELKKAGFKTMAQDKATSVVFGMPKVAYELGAVDQLTPLAQIPASIVRSLKKAMKAS
jgi:chemotaxis response regulator CheB